MKIQYKASLLTGIVLLITFILLFIKFGRTPARAAGEVHWKRTGLTGLELIGASVKYDGRLTEYAVNVPNGTESIRVKATVEDGASLKINGKQTGSGEESESIDLPVGYSIIILEIQTAQSETNNVRIYVKRYTDETLLYNELHRPQFHNSTEIDLCNDPNGLVYNEYTKEYHLFYQQNVPVYEGMETKCWAHAVSTDLVHWKTLPLAIMADDFGEIYSGSAVIDRDNSSGLFDESVPPGSRMVALFTYYSGHKGDSEFGIEKQGLAYSVDHGVTWIKYDGNPIIKNGENFKQKYTTGFRDPKVFWYEDSSLEKGGIWMMAVAGAQVRMFTSPDLIHWEFNNMAVKPNGRSGIISECPDLFSMQVNGETKWVFMGNDYNDGDSSVYFIVGYMTKDEDGKYQFIAETNQSASLNANNEVYASQTFFNDAKGRRLMVCWIRDWVGYNEGGNAVKNWLGTHTLPVELSLVTNSEGGYEMRCTPVEEITLLRKEPLLYTAQGKTVSAGDTNILQGLNARLYDIDAEITPGSASEFGWILRSGNGEQTVVIYLVQEQKLVLDRSKSGNKGTSPNPIYTMELKPLDGGKVRIRILIDSSIVELYGNDDHVMVSTQIYPREDSTGMEFYAVGGDVTLDSMNIYEMASIWTNWQEPYEPGQINNPDPSNPNSSPTAGPKKTPGFFQNSVVKGVLIVFGAVALAVCGVLIGLAVTRKKK